MKGKLNFIIDAAMFLLMAAVTGLGFLMKYVLVPGKERSVKFGRQVDLYLWGWDRHEWGTVHLILGFVLLGFLALHIVLHWRSIQFLFSRLIGKKAWRMPLVLVFSLLLLFLLVFPFIVRIDVEETVTGESRHAVDHPVHLDSSEKHRATGAGIATALDLPQSASGAEQKHPTTHDHQDDEFRIQGSMTLEQVAGQYGIPVDSILSGLEIKEQTSPAETLGRLRKRYPFQMTDVENIIRQFKNSARQ